MATFRKRGDRWQVQVRRLGQTSLSKSFLNRKDAELWARQTETKADRAELVHDPRQLKFILLGDLVKRYRDTVTPQKRSSAVETYVLNAFLRHPICTKRLSDLSAADLAAYRDERLLTVKPNSLKRLLSPIQNMFETAKRQWKIPLRDNPINGLSIPCRSNRRERRLRDGELDQLISASSSTQNRLVLPIIQFALQTGMRRSEILGAVWNSLDCDKRILNVPMSKNGHSRTIPLSKRAVELLLAQKELFDSSKDNGEKLIFPISPNALRLAWERLTKRAGIRDLHFHDLRHEAISRFFEMGLTLPEVAQISGHRDPRMLFRYGHPQNQRILAQFDRANDTVRDL